LVSASLPDQIMNIHHFLVFDKPLKCCLKFPFFLVKSLRLCGIVKVSFRIGPTTAGGKGGQGDPQTKPDEPMNPEVFVLGPNI
jgi:hypothetical protein